MTILETLEKQQATISDVKDFELNQIPISIIDLYRDKLQLADIFFMDEKYRDFFDHATIKYDVINYSKYDTIYIENGLHFLYDTFEDANKYVTDTNTIVFENHYPLTLMTDYVETRYYYINFHIIFEDKKFIITAKYSIDRKGKRQLIDLINSTDYFRFVEATEVEE